LSSSDKTFFIPQAESFISLGDRQKTLIDSVRAGTLPHAVLLLGVAGTGKRSLARLLACALLCTGEGAKPCLACRSCKRVMASTHADLLMPDCTDTDRVIKVDQLRSIIRSLSMHSSEGGRRVVLLENAHRMNLQSQNALLKSLEEPDSDTTFLLTASAEAQLLPTVRSRCRVVRIPPWEDARIEKELLSRGCSPDKAKELALLCSGSLGDALDRMASPSFASAKELCEKTFFSISAPRDVPLASALLKDKKDDAAMILNLTEQFAHEYLLFVMGTGAKPVLTDARCADKWENASPRAFEKVLDGLVAARKYKEANVSWQAIAERLLYIISEEII